MRRRPRVILWLLLGAIVNIAVAWWCAVSVEVFAVQRLVAEERTEAGGELWVARWERRGAIAIHRARSEDFAPSGGHAEKLIPAWTGLHELGASHRAGQTAHDRRWVLGYGWPLLSMKTTIEVPYSAMFAGARVVQGVDLNLPDYHIGSDDLPHSLPVVPIWRGFVANTLIWAMLLGAAPAVLRAGRRQFRLCRAVCPRCQYPIGASPVCTECGEALGKVDRPRRRATLAMVVALPHLRRATIALLVGGLLNVAVAWACALGVDVFENGMPTQRARTDDAYFMAWHRPGATTARIRAARIGLLPGRRAGLPSNVLPAWARQHAIRPVVKDRWIDARGWPLRSLWSEPHVSRRGVAFRTGGTAPAFETRGGIVTALPTWSTAQATAAPAVVPRVLPLRVWWPGFVVNSVFYGVFAWLLLVGACGRGRGRWRVVSAQLPRF